MRARRGTAIDKLLEYSDIPQVWPGISGLLMPSPSVYLSCNFPKIITLLRNATFHSAKTVMRILEHFPAKKLFFIYVKRTQSYMV